MDVLEEEEDGKGIESDEVNIGGDHDNHPGQTTAYIMCNIINIMSCHVMSCHDMSCHDMSCHVMSCHVMTCHDMT